MALFHKAKTAQVDLYKGLTLFLTCDSKRSQSIIRNKRSASSVAAVHPQFHEILRVDTPKAKSLDVSPVWLRHHCQCEKCFSPTTFQRMTIPSTLPDLSEISDVSVSSSSLHVVWKDSHRSSYDLQWLQNNWPKKPWVNQRQNLDWISFLEEFAPAPKDPMSTAVTYETFMKPSNEGVGKLLENIVKYGYGIVRDAPPDVDKTKEVVHRISHPQNTIYGDFSVWTSNLAHADTAYTSDFVHLHTDTTYFSEPMGLQMFHCLKHDGTGGFNSIADGFRAAKKMQREYPDLYQVLSNAVIPFQYLDPMKHYFYNEDVTIKHNILSGAIERIRYNPHDMGVINTISLDQIGTFYDSLVLFSTEIEKDPTWLKLSPGIIIFLNNWRVLHGRSEFTGFRKLCGAYIGRSDWLSKARVLGVIN